MDDPHLPGQGKDTNSGSMHAPVRGEGWCRALGLVKSLVAGRWGLLLDRSPPKTAEEVPRSSSSFSLPRGCALLLRPRAPSFQSEGGFSSVSGQVGGGDR
jgi:hypothetical protein